MPLGFLRYARNEAGELSSSSKLSIASATAATAALVRKVAARPAGPTASRRQGWRKAADTGHEPEGAEAGRAKFSRRAVGDHPREDALGQRHVRAPQRRADHQPAKPPSRQHEVAGDQHRHAHHQDRARADPVADAPAG